MCQEDATRPMLRSVLERSLDQGSRKACHSLPEQVLRGHFAPAKVFCTDDDLAATVAEISQSPFGQYHVTLWDRIRNFKVEELQDFVRSAFNFGTSVAGDTEPMKLFLAKVVEPCLKINVNTADETLTRLSAQFVPALTSKRLNAT